MESTLSLQLSDFAAAVGDYLGFGRTTTNWSGWQAANPYVASSADTQLAWIMECVQSGLRSFYYPKLDGQAAVAHKWSFLSPQRQLTTKANVTDYDLPDDVYSFSGNMTYQPSVSTWVVVENTHINRVMTALQQSYQLTGKPEIFAVYPKPHDGVSGQRFAVKFAPTPDTAYTLDYTCEVCPRALSNDRPYPYGGMIHAETILESMLAVAEARKNDEMTTHRALFQERLQASISVDIRDFQPDRLGYVGDNSDNRGIYSPWREGYQWSGQRVLWPGSANL